jgi:hypothetical protein
MMTLDDIRPGSRAYELACTDDRYRERWRQRFGLTEEEAAQRWPRAEASAAAPVPAWKRRGRFCRHWGPPTGDQVVCVECPGQAAVHTCALDGLPVIERTLKRAEGIKSCKTCDQGAPRPVKWEWVPTRQLAQDTVELLLGKLPADAAGIVGLPRSGMLPASILATHLHLPLYAFEAGQLRRLPAGGRGCLAREGPLVVVDDTVYAGAAMRWLKPKIAAGESRPLVYAAVYVRPQAARHVDHYGRLLAAPHLLEWNLFNGAPLAGLSIAGGAALDFDGVLCRDGARSLAEAVPLHLPRKHPIPLIVTGRGEAGRGETLAWLAKWGVRVKQLVMRPDTVGPHHQDIAPWKAEVYKAAKQSLFIESSTWQARKIHELSGKPCLGIETGELFQ